MICLWLLYIYACVMDEFGCINCVMDEDVCVVACVCICVCHDQNDELPMCSPKCRFISISANFPALLGAKN